LATWLSEKPGVPVPISVDTVAAAEEPAAIPTSANTLQIEQLFIPVL